LRSIVPALLLLLFAARAHAAPDESTVRVELRVTSARQGGVAVVDRGTRDGLAVGDRVVLFPLGRGSAPGRVVAVEDRSAQVQLEDATYLPPAGTKGEAVVPGDRLGRAAEPAPAPVPTPPVHPPWTEDDSSFTPDQPLLTDIRPFRPSERKKHLTGLAYAVAQLTSDPNGDFGSSLVRVGTDLVYENPFGRGGQAHVNMEFGYLTDPDENQEPNFLLRWLSWSEGGNRFVPMRWEAGRFLQSGMPEFGWLDGVEWSMRRENGHRFGVSAGFMPEPDEDFNTFSDLQLAAWYEWVSGPREILTLSAGFQQTWHDGSTDRDLLVGKFLYVPPGGWDIAGTIWVDFYTGKDFLKGSAEVTQATFTAQRQFQGGSGVVFNYYHQQFPQLLRQGEFLPPLAAEIAGNRLDRWALNGWWRRREDLLLHGSLVAWVDDASHGGAFEAGAEVRNVLFRRSRADVTVFGSFAQFEDLYGVRGTLGYAAGRAYWELLYEVGFHHILNFLNDRDDLVQHRFRASGGFDLRSGWNVSLYAEGVLYDDDLAWSVGLAVQKDF